MESERSESTQSVRTADRVKKSNKIKELYDTIVSEMDGREDEKGSLKDRGLKGFFFGKSSEEILKKLNELTAIEDYKNSLTTEATGILNEYKDKLEARVKGKEKEKKAEASAKVFYDLKSKIEKAKTPEEFDKIKKRISDDKVLSEEDKKNIKGQFTEKELEVDKKNAISKIKEKALSELDIIRRQRDEKIKEAERKNKKAGKYEEKTSIEEIEKSANEKKLLVLKAFRQKANDIKSKKETKEVKDILKERYLEKNEFKQGNLQAAANLIEARNEMKNSKTTMTKVIEAYAKTAKEEIKKDGLKR